MTETAEQLQAHRPDRLRALRITIKFTVCAVILGFVIAALVHQFRLVEWSQVHFEFLPSVLAVACLLGVSVMQLAARWTLLSAYGYRLSWRIQLPAAWLPQLGKYVPGGIASVGGLVYLLRRFGVPVAVGLSVAILLDGLAVIAGLIVSTPLLLWQPVHQRMPLAWIGCVLIVAIGLVMLHPRVFVAALNWFLKKFRRQPITSVPPIRKFLWPVLASFGQWLLAGMALWWMTRSLTLVSARMIPIFIASAALAMTLSYLMPFTPGGIGIREGLYLITLGPIIGPSVAIVVIAMRVLQTLIEIALAGLGMLLLRTVNVAQPPSAV